MCLKCDYFLITFFEYFDFMNFCTQLFKNVKCITIGRQSLFDEINFNVFLHFNCLVALYHDQCPFLQFLQVIQKLNRNYVFS